MYTVRVRARDRVRLRLRLRLRPRVRLRVDPKAREFLELRRGQVVAADRLQLGRHRLQPPVRAWRPVVAVRVRDRGEPHAFGARTRARRADGDTAQVWKFEEVYRTLHQSR
eukprot:scaffold37877_cov60-Phaeocystis_antarctica.AAC.8